jgi:hypothetical protein
VKANRKKAMPVLTPAPTWFRRTVRRADWVFVSLLLAIGAFHFATMPGMFYPGDNYAPRAEVADLLSTGSWGIDYAHRKQLGGFVEERGQYLFENDARQKFYSKYGVGCSILYLPPLLAEKCYAGKIEPMAGTRSQLFILNCYQIILTLVIAFYMYRLAGLYTARRWLCAAFVLASFYGTFMWHYLRSPTLEIFQLFSFVGAYYHLIRFLRSRTEGCETTRTWLHLAASTSWAGLLFLVKLSFGPFLAMIWLFAILAGPSERGWWERLTRVFKQDKWRFACCLLLPSLLAGSIFLAANHYRCGSIFEDGYGQWVRNGKVVARLELSFIPHALTGMFLQPRNDYNVFVHYPLLLLGLIGFALFARRRIMEFACLLSVMLSNWLLIACFPSWSGAWCYAPRLLLVPLLLASLPTIAAIEWLIAIRWKSVKVVACMMICGALLWSFQLQWYMNSLHYFTWYYLHGMFSQFKIESIDQYFQSSPHRGYIHRDLIRYVHRQGAFRPMTELQRRVPPNQRQVLTQVDAHLQQMAKPNFFF